MTEKAGNLGERFAEERRRLDLDQTELAEICGVRRNTISSYECGESVPKSDALAAFMKLGADIYYILIGRKEGDPQPVMLDPDEIAVVDDYRASDEFGRDEIRSTATRSAARSMVQETSPVYRKRIDKKQPE